MRVRVDAERCVGHGRCYTLAPGVFGADDEGHCVVLVTDMATTSEFRDQAWVGAQNCPERAIVIDADR